MKKLWGLTLVAMTALSTIQGFVAKINPFQANNFQAETIPKTDINIKINYDYADTYYVTTSASSSVYAILRWKDHASTWQAFVDTYPNFRVNGILIAAIEGWYPLVFNDLGNAPTSYFKINDIFKFTFAANNKQNESLYTMLSLNLWCDDENVYYQWKGSFKGNLRNIIGIKIEDVIFYTKK